MPVASALDSLQTAVLRSGFPPGARILVAVSGGPDSVALLMVLHRLSLHASRRWCLRVAHVNHRLRGEESEQDARFVKTMADAWGLELEIREVDVPRFARESSLSLETAARELRYGALDSILANWPGNMIALGHTLDDQAETVILRLMRGSGVLGLAAMSASRGHIVRPFLSVRRETILEALQAARVGYRLDSSNLDPRHARTLVRRTILPALSAVQPQIVPVLGRTSSVLRTAAEYLQYEAREATSLMEVIEDADGLNASLGLWRALHPALQREALRVLLRRLTGHLLDFDEAHISALCEALNDPGGRVRGAQLPHGISLHIREGRFSLLRREVSLSPLQPAELTVPGAVALDGALLTTSILPSVRGDDVRDLLTVSGPLHAYCDAGALGDRLIVRARQPGDRIRPFGLDGSRKLQDILVDRRVPAEVRQRIPVVENGRFIVWLPGLALDQRAAVTDGSRNVAHIRFQPERGGWEYWRDPGSAWPT